MTLNAVPRGPPTSSGATCGDPRQFTDWDALYPAERRRLVRDIVSRVIYDRPNGTLKIEFQGPDGRMTRMGESESPDLCQSTGSPNPR